MKNKKTLAIVAGVALTAVGAFLLGGDSLGSLGRDGIGKAVEMFAFSNHSDEAPDSESAGPGAAARVAAARGDEAESDDGPGASAMKTGVAMLTGDPEAFEAVIGAAEEATTDDPASPRDAVVGRVDAVAATSDAPVGEEEAGVVVTAPPLEPASGNADAPLGAEMEMGGLSTRGEEDYWDASDPFHFEDESVLRDMGPTYSTYGARDPFYALVTTGDQDGPASALIDPDRLRLVGIVWGDRGITALVEDDMKRGYVLREGDRVLYGRVASITRDAIVINQVIYGEFKRVKLYLEPKREGN